MPEVALSTLSMPERFVGDFGGKAQPTRQAVCALAGAFSVTGAKALHASLEQWTILFRKTCGQDWPRPKARLDRLARYYGAEHDPARPQVVLFALQSWYVLLVKLLVGHVFAARRAGFSPPGNELSAEYDVGRAGHLRSYLEALESGQVFPTLGVTDPWCGEPFGWIVSAWSPALERAVLQAAARIASYDPLAIMAHAACGGDLLKPLYESLFPRAVRHALGEFYTPAWLAEHVLDQVGYVGQSGARLLDPTCGSGTFLLAALKRWRQGSRHREIPVGNALSGVPHGEASSLSRNATEGVPYSRETRPRLAQLHSADSARVPSPTPSIVGFDLHPLAVASARANYLLAIADLMPPEVRVDVPVFARDAILDLRPEEAAFDFIVGNPPWIAWDNLPGDYREATKPHWQRYGLFSLSGNAARHGGGKKDLSMLVLYSAADRYLAPAGRLGMVITQTLFQSKGAGDGFRSFRLGADGESLRVLRVDDLVEVRPFGDAANWTSVVVLQKGEPTIYPVKYVKWSAPALLVPPGHHVCMVGGRAADGLDLASGDVQGVRAADSPLPPVASDRMGEGQGASGSFTQTEMLAQPIDPARATAPWIVRPKASAVNRVLLAGGADYTAHLGANSGGANAVYWLHVQGRGANGVTVRNLVGKAKRSVELLEAQIEPDLLYPLVRWIDVDRWSARPSAYLLLAQDPATRRGLDEARFRRDYPRTLAYLQQFQPLLVSRAAYRRYQDRQPFYSMYNIGPYTLSAAKVIWRRMDRKIRAAVVESVDDPLLGLRPIIPQETCVLIACASGDEAHYLCALLNSSLVHELVVAHSVAGGKGFGTPSILDYLPLRTFDVCDPRHRDLAGLSRQLHALAQKQSPGGPQTTEIDRLAGEVLGSD